MPAIKFRARDVAYPDALRPAIGTIEIPDGRIYVSTAGRGAKVLEWRGLRGMAGAVCYGAIDLELA